MFLTIKNSCYADCNILGSRGKYEIKYTQKSLIWMKRLILEWKNIINLIIWKNRVLSFQKMHLQKILVFFFHFKKSAPECYRLLVKLRKAKKKKKEGNFQFEKKM